MPAARDIRALATPRHADVVALNFIRDNPAFCFRSHFQEGLRSRIVEVLNREDFQRERQGVLVNGTRRFPRARPLKMLRLFRHDFASPWAALAEARTFQTLRKYLGFDYLAPSAEFIVTYQWQGGESIILCGLQQYVPGETFNPWAPLGSGYLEGLFRTMSRHGISRHGDPGVEAEPPPRAQFIAQVRANVHELIARVKRMILEAGKIPDLAGIGNMLLTPAGAIKLVDINNVSPVTFDSTIYLDDQAYPVCDKSIEVLALLERELLGGRLDSQNPIWRHYLCPRRRRRVRDLERSSRTDGEGDRSR